MNNIEMSLFSFLADVIIRVKSSAEFDLAVNELKINTFSEEFNSVIKQLRVVSENIPKNVNQDKRISYFEQIAQNNLESKVQNEQYIGEALTWALRIKQRNIQSKRR